MSKKLQGLLPLGLLCVVAFFALVFFGSASMEFCGFGVDKDGLLYIGRLHEIEVYNEGIQVHTITTPADRGWIMTVDANSNIVVCNMSTVYTLDTNGMILATEEDVHSEQYYETCDIRRVKDLNGNVYELKYKWVRPTVLKNDSVVYMVPFVDLVARILFYFGIICFLVGILACKTVKRNKSSF